MVEVNLLMKYNPVINSQKICDVKYTQGFRNTWRFCYNNMKIQNKDFQKKMMF